MIGQKIITIRINNINEVKAAGLYFDEIIQRPVMASAIPAVGDVIAIELTEDRRKFALFQVTTRCHLLGTEDTHSIELGVSYRE